MSGIFVGLNAWFLPWFLPSLAVLDLCFNLDGVDLLLWPLSLILSVVVDGGMTPYAGRLH